MEGAKVTSKMYINSNEWPITPKYELSLLKIFPCSMTKDIHKLDTVKNANPMKAPRPQCPPLASIASPAAAISILCVSPVVEKYLSLSSSIGKAEFAETKIVVPIIESIRAKPA